MSRSELEVLVKMMRRRQVVRWSIGDEELAMINAAQRAHTLVRKAAGCDFGLWLT